MIFISFKIKTIINCSSGDRLCGSCYIGENKRSAEDRWNEHNTIIQLKVQNHPNTFKTISIIVLHGLLFQMLQKLLRPEKIQRHHILLYGNLMLTCKILTYDLVQRYLLKRWIHYRCFKRSFSEKMQTSATDVCCETSVLFTIVSYIKFG